MKYSKNIKYFEKIKQNTHCAFKEHSFFLTLKYTRKLISVLFVIELVLHFLNCNQMLHGSFPIHLRNRYHPRFPFVNILTQFHLLTYDTMHPDFGHLIWNRKYWKPYLLQKLDCNPESENAFDRFAIKMSIKESGKGKIGGHLPREISRPTKFLLARGAVMHAEISCVKYRNYPLVQGGLELSCIVFVSMPPTVLNENLISRYMSLVASLFVEPSKETEVGNFEREKETDFSVDSTTTKTKTNVQTKNKRKSQETSTEKQNPAKKQIA